MKLPVWLLLTLTTALAAQPPAAPGMIVPQYNAGRPRPTYAGPYDVPSVEEITKVLNRVRDYVDASTRMRIVDRQTGAEITDFSHPSPTATVERVAFNIVSYEWGVTYAGMLRAAEATGDARFREYVDSRLKFVAQKSAYFRAQLPAAAEPGARGGPPNYFRSVLMPRTLDDSGSMCAAMIKAHRAGLGGELRPLIDNYATFITTKQFRLADGTFARNRSLPNSLWLDDLYMSVPALAQLGVLTGDRRYFDDAVKQVTQFAARMFNREKKLWMHGWVQEMAVHPEFRWARANGWALLAMTELLDVLPPDHPGRAAVMDLYCTHIRGLADVQARDGRWHQLLDRNDSYLETSATAIYAYCIAHGINQGWLDPLAHGPMAVLAWHGASTQVNDQGQVENVCVGTGMAFDPAFYYARPVSSLAAHGYGPVLLAGAEMITLAKSGKAVINDDALLFGKATGL